jgi:hypothetical protein
VLKPLQLAARLHAQLRVEVRQRLVHQKRARLAHHRARERHPLPLAARQLARPSMQQTFNLQHRGHTLNAPPDFIPHHLPHAQRVGDVLRDRHVRVERVRLEDHRHVARPRGHVVHALGADQDVARGRVFESRQHPQRRRLPAPRRPEQHDELAVLDAQRQVVHDHRRAEPLGHVDEADVHKAGAGGRGKTS